MSLLEADTRQRVAVLFRTDPPFFPKTRRVLVEANAPIQPLGWARVEIV